MVEKVKSIRLRSNWMSQNSLLELRPNISDINYLYDYSEDGR